MKIVDVLIRRFSQENWVLRGDELEWLSDTPKPTEAELTALWPTVQAEIAAEKQAKIDSRNSAVAKLEALGLTVDEVRDVFGIEV